jgi:hypothetical protein
MAGKPPWTDGEAFKLSLWKRINTANEEIREILGHKLIQWTFDEVVTIM